jgi:hypothetical protein
MYLWQTISIKTVDSICRDAIFNSIRDAGDVMKNQDFGVDFAAISAANDRHVRAWQQGMDTARVELDISRLKREFMQWVLGNDVQGVEHFETLADWRFMTVGRMAWLMNNGAEIPESSMEFLIKQMGILRDSPAEVTVAKAESDDDRPLTAESKRRIQYVNLYSYIDAVRVKFKDDHENIEEMIRKRIQDIGAAMPQLKKLYQHYRELLTDSLSGRDNPLVAETVEPLVVVVNVLASMTGNAAAMSASKKKVSAKVIKAASKAKVKNLDADTNIVGLSPALLVGNQAALIYNTKNRKAMLYVAAAGSELSIKGTYIAGYDEAQSFGKTLRKPKETFSKMLHNATAKRVNDVLNKYIKGKRHALNGKLNKDVMIIKVFK